MTWGYSLALGPTMELGHKDNPESPIEEGDRKWQVAEENNDVRTNLRGSDPSFF